MGVELKDTLTSLLLAASAVTAGLLVYLLLTYLVNRHHSKKPFKIRGIPLKLTRLRGPLRLIIPVFFLRMVSPFLEMHPTAELALDRITSLCLIAAFAWLVIRMLAMVRDVVLGGYDLGAQDNLKARRIYTQMRVLERVVVVLVMVIAASGMLMTFDAVRQLGVSILASAGIIGIILGFAAQRSLATLFAGIQIAITQPMRIEDAVVVENEWGWIEEITLTYVVVRLWDQRRLIVPITHFIEKPFQNWTRNSSRLIGSVFILIDYTVPVEEVRRELKRILDNSPLWDKRVWNLQVTNTTERGVQLRALMSASDSSSAWDLRCHVREQLVEFLKRHFPDSLPRLGAVLTISQKKKDELEESPQLTA
jgi:small-conductance mechanosensitive channel